jgi:DNA-binding CsgD family transcriptional regulator
MKNTRIDAKHQRMLELLAQGASSKVIARTMGYRDGTMRVYLHNLYRKIGVRNKTSAAIWYLGTRNEEAGRAETRVEVVAGPGAEETFGDMALREGLYASLGVMSIFLGAYGRVWEIAMRLKGTRADAALNAKRAQSRRLWRALLEGDCAYGKRVYETNEDLPMPFDSPSEAVVLLCLLLIGGYAVAADRLGARLARKRKGALAISASEHTLVRSLRDALKGNDDALASLFHLATEQSASPVLRQTAMVALFHAYRARKDPERARGTANAIWAEAEASRQHLQAMGERPLVRDTTVPPPERVGAKGLPAYREKVAATR